MPDSLEADLRVSRSRVEMMYACYSTGVKQHFKKNKKTNKNKIKKQTYNVKM